MEDNFKDSLSLFIVSIEFVATLICLIFCFFGSDTCGILVPQPGIKPASARLEGKVLTTGHSVSAFFFF